MYNDVKYKSINQLLGKAEIMRVEAIYKSHSSPKIDIFKQDALKLDIRKVAEKIFGGFQRWLKKKNS